MIQLHFIIIQLPLNRIQCQMPVELQSDDWDSTGNWHWILLNGKWPSNQSRIVTLLLPHLPRTRGQLSKCHLVWTVSLRESCRGICTKLPPLLQPAKDSVQHIHCKKINTKACQFTCVRTRGMHWSWRTGPYQNTEGGHTNINVPTKFLHAVCICVHMICLYHMRLLYGTHFLQTFVHVHFMVLSSVRWKPSILINAFSYAVRP